MRGWRVGELKMRKGRTHLGQVQRYLYSLPLARKSCKPFTILGVVHRKRTLRSSFWPQTEVTYGEASLGPSFGERPKVRPNIAILPAWSKHGRAESGYWHTMWHSGQLLQQLKDCQL